MLKKLIAILLVIFWMCPANAAQNARLARQGSVARTDYLVEFPFRYVDRHVFIDVLIRGKTYTFLLDSGYELSAVDTLIAGQSGSTPKAAVEISGTSFQTQQAALIDLPRLTIASVDFDSTAAVVQDLSMLRKHYGCMEVHGIIGNNVMRKAAWQIDYQAQVIRMSDRVARLAPANNAIPVRMKSSDWGLAKLELAIDGAHSDFIFDLGSGGRFTTGPALRHKFDPAGDADQVRSGDKLKFLARTVHLGSIGLADQIISVEPGAGSLLGNDFFENYRITIDWPGKVLWLEPRKEIAAATLSAFEATISPDYSDNSLRMRNQWESHRLTPTPEDGTQVLQIAGTDVSGFSHDQLCAFWAGKEALLARQTLDLVVKAGDGSRAITLTKKQLLPAR